MMNPHHPSPTVIKVMTYNIHKGFSAGNLRFVLHQIREQIRASDVDVVFLQEIQGEHSARRRRIHEWPEASQFEFLADQIWQHYAYGKNAIYEQGHHGNAILSKYPFIHWDNLNVSSMRRASRSILHGVISIPKVQKKIHVVCIHLDLMAYERVRQLKILDARIKEHIPPDEPLILAGDFNDWGKRIDRILAADLRMEEAYKYFHGRHAKTYPSWLPIAPVDRIYYRSLKPLESSCFSGPPWHRLSDHTPLYASFDLGGD
jgi:endonuclease/exonuclease/phosphatase family metal-dependent hydrolase